MKKQKQADLTDDHHAMTLRAPKEVYKMMKKKRKDSGESFNKITISALKLYLAAYCTASKPT